MVEDKTTDKKITEHKGFFSDFKFPGDVVLDSIRNLFTRKKPIRIFDYIVGLFVIIFLSLTLLGLLFSLL
ncbi:hypothetical protein A3H04_03670 [Candidatus Giovannonibacteria bacterium RIFCSPLOWO2_12_FULL_43_11c]|uniref:Uncharacterized protein n=1 Tax=Candidatus Giovannonibacteria bacterium RIFCSPHIGHO2_12_FULL_43_15 TaxID=1798341 RepID=A0A1F5WNJ6_9BACT|nr:MAG: hypothetical protein A3B97_01095 [Candidatus Giovannonibacteria bacterium RIFCSPHIGHO2_02_FULL_43_32]OGF77225.1 MAG: hypothetical protein A3F23_01920 [Candidatus Giovannonibacteria bacterium RIFCSPHIGHO2_12_FULL_43_15]OGF92106.1 MAG: hypothetical protein A3H04_03670 [Candidatus Giovannonibacteria bacterium RIFCSPLOWO2_12_FULL_43_11c]